MSTEMEHKVRLELGDTVVKHVKEVCELYKWPHLGDEATIDTVMNHEPFGNFYVTFNPHITSFAKDGTNDNILCTVYISIVPKSSYKYNFLDGYPIKVLRLNTSIYRGLYYECPRLNIDELNLVYFDTLVDTIQNILHKVENMFNFESTDIKHLSPKCAVFTRNQHLDKEETFKENLLLDTNYPEFSEITADKRKRNALNFHFESNHRETFRVACGVPPEDEFPIPLGKLELNPPSINDKTHLNVELTTSNVWLTIGSKLYYNPFLLFKTKLEVARKRLQTKQALLRERQQRTTFWKEEGTTAAIGPAYDPYSPHFPPSPYNPPYDPSEPYDELSSDEEPSLDVIIPRRSLDVTPRRGPRTKVLKTNLIDIRGRRSVKDDPIHVQRRPSRLVTKKRQRVTPTVTSTAVTSTAPPKPVKTKAQRQLNFENCLMDESTQ